MSDLSVRVIPCLDVDAGRVVKGVNFVELRDAGDPVDLARLYDREGADELVFYDITASSDGRGTAAAMAAAVAEQIFIPFTIGGGVRTVDDARALLRAGADKVSINSAAVSRPELIAEMAAEFGSQCCVVSIDGTNTGATPSGFEVHVRGGREPVGIDVIEWAQRAEALGAGEIVLNSMDRDGTREGFDLVQTAAVSAAVGVPVIASGGVGHVDHLAPAVTEAGAAAVLAASIFHFGEFSVADAKTALSAAGVRTRPPLEATPGPEAD